MTLITVALSDLNHDGNVDVISEDGPGSVGLVWLGNGDGTLGPVSKVLLNPYLVCGDSSETPCIAAFPVKVVPGDFDEDGTPDLLFSNANSRNLTLVKGNGDGTFSPPAHFRLPGSGLFTEEVAAGDINKDGNLDAVVLNTAGDGKAAILDGHGSGGLHAPRILSVGSNPMAIDATDVNGDGHPDLTIVGATGISVLPGNGGGEFGTAPATFALPAGASPRGLAYVDLNGDHRRDLVTANFATATNANDVSVLLNTTTPPPADIATLDAHVGAFLELSGGSADFGTVVPTGALVTYYATGQLAVRSTYPNIWVDIRATDGDADMGGLGIISAQPHGYEGNWAPLIAVNGPMPAFVSVSPANQVVPVNYRLEVPGGTVLSRGAKYSEQMVYTASTYLP